MHEPTSLVELSAALGLDSSTIGDAHCAAAEEVAKRLAEVPLDEQADCWEQGMVSACVCVCVLRRLAEVPLDEQADCWEQGMVRE